MTTPDRPAGVDCHAAGLARQPDLLLLCPPAVVHRFHGFSTAAVAWCLLWLCWSLLSLRGFKGSTQTVSLPGGVQAHDSPHAMQVSLRLAA